MEQRALLAVALIAGSVTAAGAGGYFAVRQLAAEPAATVSQAESTAPAPTTTIVDGTEAEISPAPTTAEPEPGAPGVDRAADHQPAGRPEAVVPPAPRVVPQEARPRPSAPAAARPAPAPRAVPAAPTQPAPTPTPTASREEQSRPGTWNRPPQPPVEAPVARDDAAAPVADRWPSRDTTDPGATGRDPQDRPHGDTDIGAGSHTRASTSVPEPPATPVRRMEAVTIPADAVIGVQIETTVTSQTARVEDPVRARVTRDVFANGEVVVPAGSRLLGSVTLVEEGGKIRERARLGVRFHTLVLADGTEVRLPTETIYRDGDSPAGRSAAKIGGAAVGGAVLGAILGGGRGAVIGAATGAGSGTAVAMAGERRPAELRAGQPVTVRVSDSVASQIER